MNNKTNAILTDFALSYTPPVAPTAAAPASPATAVADNTMSVRDRIELNRNKWLNTALDLDFMESSSSRLCGMKRLGISHIKDNKPCQDSFRLFYDEASGTEIITAADGHGDKKHDLSAYGSDFACRAVIMVVSKALADDSVSVDSFLRGISFKEAIRNTWEETVLSYHYANYPDDTSESEKILTRYGTTLLFAIHYNNKLYVGRLGDGGIILSRRDKYHTLFADDDKLGTSTCSLCMENSQLLLNVKVFDSTALDSVMLMTDGMFDIFTAEKYLFDNMNQFLSGIDKPRAEMGEFYGSLYNKYVEYMTDDVTVCLMSLKQPATVDFESFFSERGIVPDSIRVREHSTKVCYRDGGFRYAAIFSRDFSTTPVLGDELFGFVKPEDSFMLGDYVVNIYPDSAANDYKNIYSLIDDMIKGKKSKIRDELVIRITDCLYPLISSSEKAFLYNNTALITELIEYSEEDNCVRIFAFNEKNPGITPLSSVIAQLLLYVVSGSILNPGHIDTIDALKDSCSRAVYDNIARIGTERAKALLRSAKGNNSPVNDSISLTHSCMACNENILTYSGISTCPFCHTTIKPRAVISAENGVYEYICAGVRTTISTGSAPAIIEAVINPNGGQLGLKNCSAFDWYFPVENIVINPGQIKGILKDTSLRINDTEFKINLIV